MIKDFFKSLQFRILLITVVATVPFIAFSVYDAEQDRERGIKDLKDEALQLVNFTLVEETQTIDGTRQLLISLSNLANEHQDDSTHCKDYLSSLLPKIKRYVNLGIVDKNGFLFASGRPTEKIRDFKNHEFFREVMQSGGFSIGEYFVDPVSHKRIVNLGYPILDEKQRIKAVLFASLDVTYIDEIEKDLVKIFHENFLFIKIDNEGDILATNFSSDELTKNIVTPSFLKSILKQGTGMIETLSSSNQKYFLVFTSTKSKLFQKELCLIVGVNNEEFFTEINKTLYRNLFLIGVLFVMVLVSVLIFSDKYILRIVKNLIKATKEMSTGNLSVRSNVSYSSGELGQLAMTFDRMVESLEEQNKARERYEKALLESEERYRLLFENSLDAILLTEPGGNIYSANPAACRMFQKTEEEICRLGRAGLVDISDPRLPILLEERRRTGKTMGEMTMLRKDGTIFPAELTSSLFKDSYGQLRSSMIIRDITERKRMEDEVHRLVLMLNAAPGAITIHDTDGRFLYANQRALDLHGYTRDEFLSLTTRELDVPVSGQLFESRVKKLLDEGEITVEVGHFRKDGTILPLEIFGKLTTWGDKTVILSIATDITGRKRAEEALEKSEKRLRLEINRMPIGYIVWDKDFQTVTWNPAAEKIFGFTFDEVKGRHPYEIIVPREAQPQVDDIWHRSLAGDESAHSVNENRTKDGRTIVCDWTNTPLKLPDGTVIGVMAMVQDITERKQAETELITAKAKIEESEIRFKAITNQTTEGIALADLEGNYTFVNPAYCSMTGYSEEELLTMTVFDVKAKSQPFGSFIKSKSTKEGLPIEVKMQRKDKTDFFSEIIGRVIKIGGQDLVLGTVRDITERKQAEEKLIRHQNELKLLSSELINTQENEKKTLALELHDEIGQALTAMKINLSSVMKNIPTGTDNPDSERLKETDQFLDSILSRVHEISLDLRPVMLDVLGFVSTIKSYGNQFSKRTGIEVHIENKNKAKPDTDHEIHLFRIVQEALTNTAKHAEAQNINIQMKSKNKWFHLIIEDDGKGFITGESGEFSGNSRGIGLIGMNERVNLMQGEINITSVPPKGTKIEIKVPLNGQKK